MASLILLPGAVGPSLRKTEAARAGGHGSNPQAQFNTYKTYYWAMKPQGNSPLMAQRIVDGVDSRLQAKGWQLGAKGDVAVAAHVTTQEKQTLDTFYSGGALGGWGWRGGFGGGMATTQVDTFEEGTLIVDMSTAAPRRRSGGARPRAQSPARPIRWTPRSTRAWTRCSRHSPGSGSGKSL